MPTTVLLLLVVAAASALLATATARSLRSVRGERNEGGRGARRGVTTVFAVAILSLISSAAAGLVDMADGDAVRAGSAPSVALDVDSALEMTAAVYARVHGVAEGEAKERIVRQEEMVLYARRVASTYPDRFAGAWIDNGVMHKLVVAVAGWDPVQMPPSLLLSADRVEIRTGLKNSLNELRGAADRIVKQLQVMGVQNSVVAVDIKSNSVRVTKQLGTPKLSLSELVADVIVDELEAAVLAGFDHTYGGDRTITSSGGLCTTSFTVRKYGVGDGVLTAGHCINDRIYKQENGVTYGMDFVRQHKGQYGDFQWHLTDHNEYDQFYVYPGIRVTATNVVNEGFVVGQFVAGYGRGTATRNYGSDVYDEWATVTIDGIQYGRMVILEDYVTTGGDSGGPWWIGNGRPAGIHSGYVTVSFKKRSVFGQARFVDDALGVNIK